MNSNKNNIIKKILEFIKGKKVNKFVKHNELVSISISHFNEYKEKSPVQNVENFKTNLLIIANEKNESNLYELFLEKLENGINSRKVLIFDKLDFIITWQSAKNDLIAFPVLENKTSNESSLISLDLKNENNLFTNFQKLVKVEISNGFGINFFDKFIITKSENESYKILFSEKVLLKNENRK
ncbi:MSC_0623 family F1-like ATPase-associated protein [[Mycoplasma] mobile]|uniref:Expressed protein n=1 Tax=Mycoplasma mobile (strain ATCC 43663 / 163K / NCTC 11711) TaxID=267748 RepID=Q6KHY9_MYCM1|nr:DUF2714 domain-containing protein [[Mycoplasma] mobile]AAT27787.1 expressed protein [Mycoplasma mobile 163K]